MIEFLGMSVCYQRGENVSCLTRANCCRAETYEDVESMPIRLEFSTLKSLDNFPNVSSQNDLLQWGELCVIKSEKECVLWVSSKDISYLKS